MTGSARRTYGSGAAGRAHGCANSSATVRDAGGGAQLDYAGVSGRTRWNPRRYSKRAPPSLASVNAMLGASDGIVRQMGLWKVTSTASANAHMVDLSLCSSEQMPARLPRPVMWCVSMLSHGTFFKHRSLSERDGTDV